MFLITCSVILGFSCYTQNRNLQWYFYLKAGAKQNLSTYQDFSGTTQRGINTPEGLQALIAIPQSDAEINPNSNLSLQSYTLTYPVGFYVTTPVFITSGIEYQPLIFRNLYRTNDVDSDGYFYIMDELNTMQSLAIPLFIDTRPLYQKVTAYAGIRMHYNLQNWQLQKVSWNGPDKLRKANQDSGEFSNTSISYACGITFSFISLEFSMHPKSFFNAGYTDDYRNKPYQNLSDQSIKSLTLSLMIGKLKHKKQIEIDNL